MTRTLRRLARLAIVALGPPPERDDSAATNAFDAIAAACGCPEWDYPGQLVRDVEQVVRERDEALRARDLAERDVDEMAGMLSTLRAEHAAEVERLCANIRALTPPPDRNTV